MGYTALPPLVSGYYWMKRKSSERIVQVFAEPSGSFSVCHEDLGVSLQFFGHPRPCVESITRRMGAEWAGPILSPEKTCCFEKWFDSAFAGYPFADEDNRNGVKVIALMGWEAGSLMILDEFAKK